MEGGSNDEAAGDILYVWIVSTKKEETMKQETTKIYSNSNMECNTVHGACSKEGGTEERKEKEGCGDSGEMEQQRSWQGRRRSSTEFQPMKKRFVAIRRENSHRRRQRGSPALKIACSLLVDLSCLFSILKTYQQRGFQYGTCT